MQAFRLPDATDTTAGARRRRRRKRLLIFLLLGLSALPSLATSYITITLFGERAVVTSDAWAPVPIDVRAEPVMLLGLSGMLPGDQNGGQLLVANVGVDPLRYALFSTSTDPDGRGLRDVLVTEIRSEGSGCDAFVGPLLYQGRLLGAGFGDRTPGGQSGDRLLGAGERERLCVRVRLPFDAGNRHQRSVTASTFTVVAEHAAAYP